MGRACSIGVALVAAASACGDNLPPDGETRSGSRLKLAWYVYEAGPRERETSWYYDAALRERCSPTLWSDGNHYCTPAHGSAVYVSDACTRALGRAVAGEPPAELFATQFRLASQPTPVPSRLFRRGNPAQAPLSIWEKTSTGCIGPMEPGDDFEYFELGAELAGDLVRIRRGEPEGIGELAVIYETSDDGLRVPAAYYHRGVASECTTPDRPNAETVACEPVAAMRASYFHEATCTDVVLGTPSLVPPPLAYVDTAATGCRTFYLVGDEVSAPPLYERNDLGCHTIAAPAGQRFFAMESAQPQPVFTRLADMTPHRLRTMTRESGDVRLRDPSLYDAELGTECRHDDELRCAPKTTVMVQSFFADAQCQAPLSLALVPTGDCDPPVRYATDEDGRYYQLVTPHTAPIYVLSTGDTCGSFVPPVPLVAYIISEELDPTNLLTAELQIDP